MAFLSVPDFSLFINHQIEISEKINAYLSQAKALMAVTVGSDGFYDFSKNILHDYFSISDNLIEESLKLNQINLDQLLKTKFLNNGIFSKLF